MYPSSSEATYFYSSCHMPKAIYGQKQEHPFPRKIITRVNKAIVHSEDISRIFSVFILHLNNLKGLQMLSHITTTRKISSSVFRENMTALEKTEEEQTKAIRDSFFFSGHTNAIVNLGKKQKKQITMNSSS